MLCAAIKEKNTPILTGYQIFHNYLRPYMGPNGMTPAEVCGIIIEENNKWKTLIQNANKEINIDKYEIEENNSRSNV